MKISQWIAKIGQNPDFGYFFAHAGAAQYAVSRFPRGYIRLGASIAAVTLAIYKEFVFDLNNEKNPPQTVMDSTKDFIGYLTGIIVAQFDK